MQSILSRLHLIALHALQKVVGKDLSSLDSSLCIPELTQSTQVVFGHYQCNNALKLSKVLKMNPREVAQKIILNFDKKTEDGTPFISHIEIAGPGFINITLEPSFLSQEVSKLLQDERCGIPLPSKKERIIVEFSSPNIAKELHVGHLRSTIIGDSLARLFEFLGHDILRLNHIGDWGTQFGMLIAYLTDCAPKVLSAEEETDLPSLMQWYKLSKKKFDEDPEFKKRSQLQVVKLQSGDPLSLKAWQMICGISRKAFQDIYDLLDVSLVERGESFYNPFLQEVVDELDRKGLITRSDGAKCIFLEGFTNRDGNPLPMIIQKSDGGFNYDTTDMAALRHRILVEKADRIIIVTDLGQSLHFQLIFKAAENAGYYDPQKQRIDHVPFGVVLGADGKKFKTRSGDTEKLIDLLTEAIAYAREVLKDRLSDLSETEIEKLATVLGIDALKYADLSCHRLKDYQFSYERMLKFEGNTAAFLLYAFVRIQSIKRKCGKEIIDTIKFSSVNLEHPSEITLGLHLLQFGEALEIMARDLLPNRLTDYLYQLAEKFHAFFRDCRVEGQKEEKSRLILCEVTGKILETGLHILGLKTLDRM